MIVLGLSLLIAGLILMLFGFLFNTDIFSAASAIVGGSGSPGTPFIIIGVILMVLGVVAIVFGIKRKKAKKGQ